MIKTTVNLSTEVITALDDLAVRLKCSRTEIVRKAIARYLGDCAPQLPSSVGIFEDSEVTSENVDEWLRANWHPE